VASVSERASGKGPGELAGEAREKVRFEEEALEHADRVYQVARHLAGSREDAEELMQETYARAFRSWRSYEPGTNMGAWLLRILTNLNIDRGRKKQRRPLEQPLEEGDHSLYDSLEQVAGTSGEDEERLVQRLSQSDIVEALAGLPHDFRDVLVLVDLGEFSYQETAQILSIPVGTVMSRLHRARRLLKQSLASSVSARKK
jgi:RNA polymerase sigma-70 factor (ECF subfamily)